MLLVSMHDGGRVGRPSAEADKPAAQHDVAAEASAELLAKTDTAAWHNGTKWRGSEAEIVLSGKIWGQCAEFGVWLQREVVTGGWGIRVLDLSANNIHDDVFCALIARLHGARSSPRILRFHKNSITRTGVSALCAYLRQVTCVEASFPPNTLQQTRCGSNTPPPPRPPRRHLTQLSGEPVNRARELFAAAELG